MRTAARWSRCGVTRCDEAHISSAELQSPDAEVRKDGLRPTDWRPGQVDSANRARDVQGLREGGAMIAAVFGVMVLLVLVLAAMTMADGVLGTRIGPEGEVDDE